MSFLLVVLDVAMVEIVVLNCVFAMKDNGCKTTKDLALLWPNRYRRYSSGWMDYAFGWPVWLCWLIHRNRLRTEEIARILAERERPRDG